MLCVLIIVIAIFLGVVMGTLFSDQKEIKEMEKVEGVGGV
jgi:uncharacterized protein YneF (UPF0154 family)